MTFNVLEYISIETPEGIITLSPGQVIRLSKEDAFSLIENRMIAPTGRVAYRIYSEILQAHLWVVDIDGDRKALRVSENVTEAIYTADEIWKLKGMDKEGLKAVHRVKNVFKNSMVEKVNKGKAEG
jgi:hypothetical protein